MQGYPQDLFRLPEFEAKKSDLLLKIQKEWGMRSSQGRLQRGEILKYLQETHASTYIDLDEPLREKLFSDVVDDFLLLSSFQGLASDLRTSAVLVNSYDRVSLVRNGKTEKSGFKFEGKQQVLRLIEILFAQSNRSLDYSEPLQEIRLQDGSQLTAILPPVAVDGPSLILKKPPSHTYSAGYLVKNNTLSSSVMHFLHACVAAHLNIFISGLKDSGKTTLLNALAAFIPEQERIISVEDQAELTISHPHILRLETRPGSAYGTGLVSQSNLVAKAIRLSPDRLIVGEIKGNEASQVMKALCSGQEGFLSTINAHNPYDTINRLESFCQLEEPNQPLISLREQLATAIDLIVQMNCLKNDMYRVISIAEVSGMAGENIVLSEIFKFQQTGKYFQGVPEGTLMPTGTRPLFNNRLEAAGFLFGPEIFGTSLGDVLSRKR